MPHDMRPTVAATYMFARVRPVNDHSSVKLHQRCAVQGEGLPHHQLDWVLRKQLDIVNLTSCPGKRERGEGETEGQREGGSERSRGDIVSDFSFLAGPEELYFLWTRGAILLEAVCHKLALFPFMFQAIYEWSKLKWNTVEPQFNTRERRQERFGHWPVSLIFKPPLSAVTGNDMGCKKTYMLVMSVQQTVIAWLFKCSITIGVKTRSQFLLWLMLLLLLASSGRYEFPIRPLNWGVNDLTQHSKEPPGPLEFTSKERGP